MTANRWERLLEQKPVPILEQLLEEVSRLIATELAQWPLPVMEWDALTGEKLAAVVKPDAPRPPQAAYEEAFALARWELQREHEAVDDYMRNQRWLTREGLAAADRTLLLFLSRWLVEQLLGLGEATHGRVRRPQMLDALERIERRALRGR